MKTLILAATALAFAFAVVAPATAAVAHDGFNTVALADNAVEKRKKTRIKGGSGCDSPRDVIKHPQCR